MVGWIWCALFGSCIQSRRFRARRLTLKTRFGIVRLWKSPLQAFAEVCLSMEPDQIFNVAEGILWVAIALILLIRSFKSSTHQILLRVSSGAFFLFGISDFIEVSTRAWYQPLSLLALKAACVITLIVCFIIFRRASKAGQKPPPKPIPPRPQSPVQPLE